MGGFNLHYLLLNDALNIRNMSNIQRYEIALKTANHGYRFMNEGSYSLLIFNFKNTKYNKYGSN